MTQAVPNVIIDEFLGHDPDCPVFGFNLACAYPFPPAVAQFYHLFAGRLSALDPCVYVYPECETHVTIITFVNFSLHRRPDASRLARLQSLREPVIEILRTVPAGPMFSLLIGKPVLTAKAAILPISDPTGEIGRIRREVIAALQANGELHRRLSAAGLNVPGIIHSTVMRFKSAPSDLKRFVADFEKIAASVQPVEIRIEELLLTLETKPYMREGMIDHRFPLAPV
ncbi:MAG TPA: hypothetical protein VH595_07010 [Verrucomicrobiae bacterium]|jgi:hypothetical protein|nr:hypothetical protein [Verrucomicrobiae bacterium]